MSPWEVAGQDGSMLGDCFLKLRDAAVRTYIPKCSAVTVVGSFGPFVRMLVTGMS